MQELSYIKLYITMTHTHTHINQSFPLVITLLQTGEASCRALHPASLPSEQTCPISPIHGCRHSRENSDPADLCGGPAPLSLDLRCGHLLSDLPAPSTLTKARMPEIRHLRETGELLAKLLFAKKAILKKSSAVIEGGNFKSRQECW